MLIEFKAVPCGNLMPPPQLARDAPGLNVLHPIEIGLFPTLRDENGLPITHRVNRRLCQLLGANVPLVGKEGFHDLIRAVAVGYDGGVRLDPREFSFRFKLLDNFLARDKSINAVIERNCSINLWAPIASLEIEIWVQRELS